MNKKNKHIVYRYIDNKDGIIKYVGITSRSLLQRIKEHEKLDKWTKITSNWRIEFFYVDTKSESEAWESHLIAKYETYNWFNKAKSNWGIITEFNYIYLNWEIYSDNGDIFDFPVNLLPVITNFNGLVSARELCINYDLPMLEIKRMIARYKLQPLARTKNNDLLFIDTDEEKVFDLMHTL